MDKLTIKQAAGRANIPVHTLRYWSRVGKVAVKKHPLNGRFLYDPRDIDALVDKLQEIQI